MKDDGVYRNHSHNSNSQRKDGSKSNTGIHEEQ